MVFLIFKKNCIRIRKKILGKLKKIKYIYPERQRSFSKMMYFVQYCIASGIDTSILANSIEFPSCRQRSEYLTTMWIQTLCVLILFGRAARNSEGNRTTLSRVLENRY